MVMEVVAMRTRQFIHDPQELLSQGKALVKDNSDIKFAYRVTMVNLLLGGMSARELAEHCGDGETTLMSWVKKVDENGWDSLRAKKQTGQPRRLTDEQIAKLKENVSSNPNNFGFNLNLLRYYTLAVFYQGSVSKIFDNGVYVFKSHTSQIKNSFLQFGRQISTGIRSC